MKQEPRDGCRCDGGPTSPEHRALLALVDRSFEQDRDRAQLALQVATSEALRVRAAAATNGHREGGNHA